MFVRTESVLLRFVYNKIYNRIAGDSIHLDIVITTEILCTNIVKVQTIERVAIESIFDTEATINVTHTSKERERERSHSKIVDCYRNKSVATT